MFKSLKRIVYQVTDVEKAKQWYSGILGAPPLFDTPFVAIFMIGNCTLSLAKSDTPMSEPSQRVETYWEVDDIDAAFQRLVESGAKVHTPIREALNIRIAKVIDPFGNIIGLTGMVQNAGARSVENQPSATAMTAAFCRALAARDEREEIKGPDNLAELFLTDEGRKPLQDAASRQWAIQNLVTSPLYGYFLSRTAFMDGVFTKSLSDNIPQIVLLGAGYDTRAYRFPLGTTRVFELDINATQKRKCEVLRQADVKIPEQVSFVNINFKVDSLEKVLLQAGFDSTKKSLFIWEGVTYYLTEEAIRSTLNFVKTHSPQGSMLCFDYLTQKLESVNAAEPFKFWIEPSGLAQMLVGQGFEMVEQLNYQEMAKRYLALRDGSIAEKVLAQFCLACARVAG